MSNAKVRSTIVRICTCVFVLVSRKAVPDNHSTDRLNYEPRTNTNKHLGTILCLYTL